MRNLSEVTRLLISAKERIKDSRCWIKRLPFATVTGEMTECRHAMRYCMLGAIQKSYVELEDMSEDFDSMNIPMELGESDVYCCALQFVQLAISERVDKPTYLVYMTRFNDNSETRHKDVMAVLSRAIELSIKGVE